MKKLLLFSLIFMIAGSAVAQNTPSIVGNWKGTIDIPGRQTSIKTHFQTKSDSLKGTIDIQGATLKLQNIEINQPDSVLFEFTTAVNIAKFRGAFQNDSTITGQFQQAGYTFSFKLIRYKPDARDSTTASKISLSYNHKDLIIKHDSINIGGTLTWPKDKATDKLVIMISGSGAQDRDETLQPLSSFKPFAVLADSLTVNGIATFRYDDRGVGKSTGSFENATLQMLSSDVKEIINHLTKMPKYNFEEIILLGHSQGGIVGGKVAANNKKIDRLILMASPSLTLDKVLQYQLKQNFMQNGFEEAKIEPALSAFQKTLEAIHNENNVKTAKKRYEKKFREMFRSMPDQNKSQITNFDSTASAQGKSLLQAFANPQMQSLLFYNPTDDLKKLEIPVLSLFGGKDTQVLVDKNKSPIKNALEAAGVPYRIEVFEQANHLFQKADTGLPQEYGTLKSEFLDGFTSTLVKWIK